MHRNCLFLILCPLLLVACAKQQPTDKPGTAIISNIKTSLDVAGIAISGAQIALPSFACQPNSPPNSKCLDLDDKKLADGILNDVGTVKDSLAARLAPYDHFDSGNADEIKQAAKDAIATLKDLHDKQVDHVKNPRARDQVDLAFKAVQKLADMILNTTPPPAS